MCDSHHIRQHSIGEDDFWGERIDEAIHLAERLWNCTGDWEQGHSLCNNFVRDR